MSVDTISTPGKKSSRERISKLPSELSEIFEAHRTDLEAKGWHQQAEVVGIFERAFDMVPDIKWTTMEDEDTGGRIWVGTHAEQVSEEQAPIERDRIRVEKSDQGIVIHLYNKDFKKGNQIRLKFATSTELMGIEDASSSLIPLPLGDAEVGPFSAIANLNVNVITGPGIVRPGIGNIPSRTVFGRRDYVTFSPEERDDVVISRKAGYCNMGQYCEYYHASTLYPYRIPDLIQLTLGDLLPEKWYFDGIQSPADVLKRTSGLLFPEAMQEQRPFNVLVRELTSWLEELHCNGSIMLVYEHDDQRIWTINAQNAIGFFYVDLKDAQNPKIVAELNIMDLNTMKEFKLNVYLKKPYRKVFDVSISEPNSPKKQGLTYGLLLEEDVTLGEVYVFPDNPSQTLEGEFDVARIKHIIRRLKAALSSDSRTNTTQ